MGRTSLVVLLATLALACWFKLGENTRPKPEPQPQPVQPEEVVRSPVVEPVTPEVGPHSLRQELDHIVEQLPDRPEGLASIETPDASHTRSLEACNDYDVILQISQSVGVLDIDKTLSALQLNPRCIVVNEAHLKQLRQQLRDYRTQHGKILAVLGNAHNWEMIQLIKEGKIPVMDRSLSPQLFDQTLGRCRAEFMRDHAQSAERADWESSRAFKTLFRNAYANALRRHHGLNSRMIIGESDIDYVARSRDLPVYQSLVAAGHREFLATDVCLRLLDFFSSQGALADAERDALWARFSALMINVSVARSR